MVYALRASAPKLLLMARPPAKLPPTPTEALDPAEARRRQQQRWGQQLEAWGVGGSPLSRGRPPSPATAPPPSPPYSSGSSGRWGPARAEQ